MAQELTFPVRLRTLRQAKDMTQAQVAKLAGLKECAISHFESGRREPSSRNLGRLAKALNTSMDYLWGNK